VSTAAQDPELTEYERSLPPGVDPTRPSPARIYDHMLGGTHNTAADRAAVAPSFAAIPELPDIAWACRGFHQRSASWIAGQGVTQFLDIGSGLPTVGNTHEVVRKVVPDARICYADIDPAVAAHAGELTGDAGGTVFITADLRDPEALLAEPALRRLIDFGQPVGLLMTAVLHFVADGSDPWGLVARYLRELAPGSYLALSHATSDHMPPRSVELGRNAYSRASEQFYMRTKDEIGRFFDGLELVPPYDGAQPQLVHLGVWGCEDPEAADSDGSRWGFCGVGRSW
jgi:hypothetical protein